MRNFEITKREVLASISIIAVMILVGILISAKITERQMDRNEVYNKAVKIDSQETFSYGMRTNVGNAFVYGTLEALDPVSYPEIDGSYMYVEKIKKLYTMHSCTYGCKRKHYIYHRNLLELGLCRRRVKGSVNCFFL